MDLFQKCYDFDLADQAKVLGIYPFFKPLEGPCGSRVICQGRCLIMIGSSNYLGLTEDPRVKQAAKEAIERFGTSGTGSRLLNGNTILHNQLEETFADFVGKEASLVFATGFLTNYGTITCLAEEGSFILSDSENHGSIVAGCKGSKATTFVYHHNDMKDIEKILQGLPKEASKLIVAEGIFSITGDVVDLPGLVAIKKRFPGTYLYLDDAHGIGVLGRDGRGTAGYFGLTEEVDLIMGTFSKSLASVGGILAGPRKVVDYLRHHSSGFILSAAASVASVAAALKSLEIMKTDQSLFDRLWENVRYVKQGYNQLNLSYLDSNTPILSIFVGDEGKTVNLIHALFENDIFATPIFYPAVPYGQAVIRTSFMASHEREDLDHVLKVFGKLAPEFDIVREKTEVPQEFTRRTKDWNFDAMFRSKEI